MNQQTFLIRDERYIEKVFVENLKNLLENLPEDFFVLKEGGEPYKPTLQTVAEWRLHPAQIPSIVVRVRYDRGVKPSSFSSFPIEEDRNFVRSFTAEGGYVLTILGLNEQQLLHLRSIVLSFIGHPSFLENLSKEGVALDLSYTLSEPVVRVASPTLKYFSCTIIGWLRVEWFLGEIREAETIKKEISTIEQEQSNSSSS